MGESFEARGVDINIVLVDAAGFDLSHGEFVVQFIAVINDLALVQSSHLLFVTCLPADL